MSAFTRIRDFGLWLFNSVIEDTELEEIDSRWPKLINAEDGSTHSPATPVVLGGAGLTVTGPFNADGEANFSSEQFFEGSLLQDADAEWNLDGAVNQSASGGWSLSGTTELEDDAVLNVKDGAKVNLKDGSILEVEDGAQLNVTHDGTLNVTGANASLEVEAGAHLEIKSTGHGIVESGGDLTFEAGGAMVVESAGQVNFESGADLTLEAGSDCTIQTVIEFSGADAGAQLRIGTLPDNDADISATKDRWLVPQDLAAPRFYTLDKTDRVPLTGETVTVKRLNCTTSSCAIQREDSTDLVVFSADSNGFAWATFIFRSGDWHFDTGGGDELTVLAIAGTY